MPADFKYFMASAGALSLSFRCDGLAASDNGLFWNFAALFLSTLALVLIVKACWLFHKSAC